MSRIINLGQREVNGGQKGDPKRVANLVGNHPHWLGDGGLEPDRFPNVDSWPEGQCQLELAVAHFPGKMFSNLTEAQERLRQEFGADGWELGGFSELMSDVLWESLQMLWEQPDICWVVAPAGSAVWLDSRGHPCAPCVYCYPAYRYLSAYWVVFDFSVDYCFLLSRKVGKSELGS